MFEGANLIRVVAGVLAVVVLAVIIMSPAQTERRIARARTAGAREHFLSSHVVAQSIRSVNPTTLGLRPDESRSPRR